MGKGHQNAQHKGGGLEITKFSVEDPLDWFSAAEGLFFWTSLGAWLVDIPVLRLSRRL